MRTILSIAAFASLLVAGACSAAGETGSMSGFDIAADADGKIKLPDQSFRSNWPMLGSWTVNGEDGAAGLHIVYTQPETIDAFRETGSFPDGAVIVKELRSASTEDLTTGRVSYAGDLEGWFVMVKDKSGRFEDNPLWGDGWGWGYFSADAPSSLVTMDYKLECKSCHVPAKDTDWIYTRAYPLLNE